MEEVIHGGGSVPSLPRPMTSAFEPVPWEPNAFTWKKGSTPALEEAGKIATLWATNQ